MGRAKKKEQTNVTVGQGGDSLSVEELLVGEAELDQTYEDWKQRSAELKDRGELPEVYHHFADREEKYLTKPHLNKWLDFPSWTLQEAVYLSHNLEPQLIRYFENYKTPTKLPKGLTDDKLFYAFWCSEVENLVESLGRFEELLRREVKHPKKKLENLNERDDSNRIDLDTDLLRSEVLEMESKGMLWFELPQWFSDSSPEVEQELPASSRRMLNKSRVQLTAQILWRFWDDFSDSEKNKFFPGCDPSKPLSIPDILKHRIMTLALLPDMSLPALTTFEKWCREPGIDLRSKDEKNRSKGKKRTKSTSEIPQNQSEPEK